MKKKIHKEKSNFKINETMNNVIYLLKHADLEQVLCLAVPSEKIYTVDFEIITQSNLK